MSWAEIFIVFFISHLVGDFILQTDRQARYKFGGLSGDRRARNALFSHVFTYTLAFVPALIWIGSHEGAVAAIVIGFAVAIPHLVIDDGRLLELYMRKVKRCPQPLPDNLVMAVDHSTHLIMLWATALLAVAIG